MGGERFEVLLPMQLVNQLHSARNTLIDAVETFKENHTEAEVKELEAALPEAFHNVIMNLTKTYTSARDEVEKDVDRMKSFFRSQTADKYKTKAEGLHGVERRVREGPRGHEVRDAAVEQAGERSPGGGHVRLRPHQEDLGGSQAVSEACNAHCCTCTSG